MVIKFYSFPEICKLKDIVWCNRSPPDSQGVDSLKDILLGEVEDDVPVKVPDLQDALLVAPLVKGGDQVTVDIRGKPVQKTATILIIWSSEEGL